MCNFLILSQSKGNLMFRRIYCILPLLVLFAHAANSQITNAKINGSSTNFTMASGDTISWEYNLPTGGTALVEIWHDINQNGTIDPAVDRLFAAFNQTDGDTNGHGGPPDMDGTVNGHIIFTQRVGVPPGSYVFRFSNNATSVTITGTCTPLASPVYTVSGTITPPAGKSARNILVTLERNGYAPNFWDAFTDSLGHYAIQMDGDTAGNPWSLRIQENPYPPAIIVPAETLVAISGNLTGMNFTLLQAAAQVAGYLRDESGNPLIDADVLLSRNDYNLFRDGRTNVSGFYQIGILSGELQNQTWRVQTQNQNGPVTQGELQGQANLPVINSGDSLFRSLTIYTVNAQITGQVQFNGSPANFPVQVIASNFDTAQAQTYSDGSTGNFSVPVSNKIFSYSVFPINLPPSFQTPSVVAHAGDAGVILNIIVTSVRENGPAVPSKFELKQNYPNPFNPSTQIDYALPSAAHVRLSVFNLLGQEVLRAVDREQHAGNYTATIDGETLPSGMYYYRLNAGDHTSVKKMLLLK